MNAADQGGQGQMSTLAGAQPTAAQLRDLAEQALAAIPDLTIVGDDGVERRARDALDELEAAARQPPDIEFERALAAAAKAMGESEA